MTQNTIYNISSQFTLDPNAATDAYLQFSESAVSKWRAGNDATDDSFRISQGNALGTNDTFIMTSAGERTLPLQPAFLAENTALASNVTGNNAVYTILYDNEIIDQTGDYVPATGIFTAPITGNYQLDATAFIGNTLAACTRIILYFVSSNRNYVSNNINAAAIANQADEATLMVSSLVDMDAADTVEVRINGVNQGGNNVDILATSENSHFSGFLQS